MAVVASPDDQQLGAGGGVEQDRHRFTDDGFSSYRHGRCARACQLCGGLDDRRGVGTGRARQVFTRVEGPAGNPPLVGGDEVQLGAVSSRLVGRPADSRAAARRFVDADDDSSCGHDEALLPPRAVGSAAATDL